MEVLRDHVTFSLKKAPNPTTHNQPNNNAHVRSRSCAIPPDPRGRTPPNRTRVLPWPIGTSRVADSPPPHRINELSCSSTRQFVAASTGRAEVADTALERGRVEGSAGDSAQGIVRRPGGRGGRLGGRRVDILFGGGGWNCNWYDCVCLQLNSGGGVRAQLTPSSKVRGRISYHEVFNNELTEGFWPRAPRRSWR